MSLSRVREGISTWRKVQRWKEICCTQSSSRRESRDFPGGPEVKYLPCNAEDNDSVLDGRTKGPTGCEAAKPACCNQRAREAVTKDPRDAAKVPPAATEIPTQPNK